MASSTVKYICTEAFRESALLKDWENPTRLQFEGAVTRLTKIISGVYDYEVGQPLADWNLGSANRDYVERDTGDRAYRYAPPENSRLIANNTSAQTVWLPSDPGNGSRIGIVNPLGTLATYAVTLDGNGRSIEGATSVAPTTDTEWMYRADEGDWVKITALTSASTMPFPDKFDDYFIIMLAKRLNPKYGGMSHMDSERRLAEVRSKLRSTYSQVVNTPIEVGIAKNYRGSSSALFTRGYY